MSFDDPFARRSRGIRPRRATERPTPGGWTVVFTYALVVGMIVLVLAVAERAS